jgi:hypothetical protein
MQIAVFSASYLAIVYLDGGLGLCSWLEKLPICPAVLGQNLNPLEIVLFFHGMVYTPNIYYAATGNRLNYRDMLFYSRISGILLKHS